MKIQKFDEAFSTSPDLDDVRDALVNISDNWKVEFKQEPSWNLVKVKIYLKFIEEITINHDNVDQWISAYQEKSDLLTHIKEAAFRLNSNFSVSESVESYNRTEPIFNLSFSKIRDKSPDDPF